MKNKETTDDGLNDAQRFSEYDGDFAEKSYNLMWEVEDEFRSLGFIDIYLKYDKLEITEEEINKYFDNAIQSVKHAKRKTWNRMWAMLSDKNCWHITYEVGQMLHNRLIKFWWPEENGK